MDKECEAFKKKKIDQNFRIKGVSKCDLLQIRGLNKCSSILKRCKARASPKEVAKSKKNPYLKCHVSKTLSN